MPDIGTAIGNLILGLYGALTRLAAPLAWLILAIRLRRGKEDAGRWRERLGHASQPRPAGPMVWVHAVSVGETMAALPFVEQLIGAGFSVVVTTVTTTSAAVAEFRTGPVLFHQYAPLDIAPAIDRFLDHWRPDFAVLIESELWPVTVLTMARRALPLAIVNGRMSVRSCRRWRRFPMVARAIFSRIDLVLAQSAGDGERFRALGARTVETVGNVKFDADVPEVPATVVAALAEAIAGRPVLLAASTHPGEEKAILAAFSRLKARTGDLLLIIAPRHPVRGPDVALIAAPWTVRRRGLGELPMQDTDVYVADTLGELGAFYRLATVAIIGGSLEPGIGGHNPIEPARIGTPMVSGPHVDNWTDVFAAFAEADGTTVATVDGLADAVESLLGDADLRARHSAAARRVVDTHAGSLAKTMTALAPLIERVRRRTGGSKP